MRKKLLIILLICLLIVASIAVYKYKTSPNQLLEIREVERGKLYIQSIMGEDRSKAEKIIDWINQIELDDEIEYNERDHWIEFSAYDSKGIKGNYILALYEDEKILYEVGSEVNSILEWNILAMKKITKSQYQEISEEIDYFIDKYLDKE